MNNINTNDMQMEIHIKSRNKVLSELQQAYTKNLYHNRSNTDNSTCNVSKNNEEICSPVVDDLLMEMNSRGLRNFEENNNTDCYRCKHFSNIPPNFSEIYDKISDCAEEYEADLNFVQAIVWLKSATSCMKDVSVEQFHLIFHKQWSNNLDTGSDSENEQSQEHDFESLNSTILLNDDEEDDPIFNNDLEYTSSIELLCNVRLKRNRDLSQSDNQQQSKEHNEIFTEIVNASSTFDSSEDFSLEKSFATEKAPILKNCVIPDSDKTYSSSSDMFKDSLDNEDNINAECNRENKELLEEDDFIEELLSTSQDSNLLQKTFLETKYDYIITPKEDVFSSASDSTFFDEISGRISELYKKIDMQQSQASVSNLHNENSSLSLNMIDNDTDPEKDNDDTPQLIAEDTTEGVDIITPYQTDSAYDTYDFEIPLTYIISDENRLLSLSSHHKSDESINRINVDYNVNDTPPSSENKYLQKETEAINDDEGNGKKRKLETAYETPKKKRFLKGNEEKISSKWLRFTLDTLNADEVAFQSVKVILLALQNEKLARHYMKKKCWKKTLEEEAVNAVLNFSDVFEAESKTVAYTQEIVQAVTSTLDKCIGNTELNMVTIFTYQISIILELCNSAKVCIETINYLINKLKSYECILTTLMNGKKADVYNTINQLHIIFYALNICLQKYRLIFPKEQDSQFEEEIVPSVIDLWKKQLTFEDAMIEDKAKTRERRWLIILDDFMVISVENCSQFIDKLRILINLVTRE
ncbi:uncharacterized protein LOC114874146 [Osmia bicornis bicornis]|uniref:uncharacterized protein LOC114874146 n=1 Tax=Osmia bicornis bicornis TaxID=1437191 RepID=UPI001EAF0CDA|nr:uncharacterized protein LOC114874146 [Osmia bicornis bicornis]